MNKAIYAENFNCNKNLQLTPPIQPCGAGVQAGRISWYWQASAKF